MIIPCKKCGKGISDQATRCPHCNAIQSKPSSKRWMYFLLILCVIGGAFVYFSSQKEDKEQVTSADTTQIQEYEEEEDECEEEDDEWRTPSREEERDWEGEHLNHNYESY